jgi:hypothetical protein
VPSFGFSVWSAILFLRQIFVSRAGPQGGFSAFQTSIGASESSPPGKRVLNTRCGSGIGQRDMYHIFAAKCHGQDSAVRWEYHPLRPPAANAPGLIKLPAPIIAGISGMDKKVDLAGASGCFDTVGAVDEIARLGFHAKAIQRSASQGLLRALAEIGRHLHLGDLESALQRGLKLALLNRQIELVACDANPGAATGRPSTYVRRHLAIRPEREAYQLFARRSPAREDAGALGCVRV